MESHRFITGVYIGLRLAGDVCADQMAGVWQSSAPIAVHFASPAASSAVLSVVTSLGLVVELWP